MRCAQSFHNVPKRSPLPSDLFFPTDKVAQKRMLVSWDTCSLHICKDSKIEHNGTGSGMVSIVLQPCALLSPVSDPRQTACGILTVFGLFLAVTDVVVAVLMTLVAVKYHYPEGWAATCTAVQQVQPLCIDQASLVVRTPTKNFVNRCG